MTSPADKESDLRHRAEERLAAQQAAACESLPSPPDRLLHELQVHQVELEMQNEEMRHTQAALRESETKFRLLSDAASECIMWIDTDSQVRYASPACQQVFGHPPAAFTSRSNLLAKLIHKDDLPEYYDHSKPRSEFRIRRDDGERWIVHRRQALYDESGNFIGLRSSSHDITERKLAEQKISSLNRALELELVERKAAEEALLDASRRKDEFLAMLAHELRNPLAPISNAAHVLGRQTDKSVVQWAQATIEGQVAHLARLVDDLLDVSRIVYGKITLKPEEVEFNALAKQALDVVRPLLESKGHRLIVRLPTEPVYMDVDPVRITQVLLNLLDNAAKYNSEGVDIEFDARVEGEEVAIRVRDNGVGIPPQLLPHIFEIFQQGERSLDRPQGGLGIGLTLVQRLVKLHGGLVEAHSEGLDKGTTFTVRLPFHLGPRSAPSEHSPQAYPSSTSIRVLVVDDEPAVADSMAVLLKMEGHDARTAESGKSALDLVPVFKPQVVLLDIGLKGMDGFETVRRLRRLPEGRELVIMAMTGYGDDETRAAALEAGYDHYLVKPVNAKKFLGLLTEVARSLDGSHGKLGENI